MNKKSFIALITLLSIVISCFFYACTPGSSSNANSSPSVSDSQNPGPSVDQDCNHKDNDKNDYCDNCNGYLRVTLDFYSVNDLHGKFCDTANQPGVDELATYFKNNAKTDDYQIILSTGDMWQGSAESNLSGGKIVTEWMNEMGFVSMSLGNHEYDWGEQKIRENLEVANFPFLAINVYDVTTNERANYCAPSVMVERGNVKVGIIGAIGDCYSSISSDKVENVEFLVGNQLTALVKEESQKLRNQGADVIIFAVHDGMGSYDQSLSNGYVDLVFEGHTHNSYCKTDDYNVYHVQGGGENEGISHAEITVNFVTDDVKINTARVVKNYSYSTLEDDAETEALEQKYSQIISQAYSPLGIVNSRYSSSALADYVAKLYYEFGEKTWGTEYDIVLGGGYIVPRSPYELAAGQRTYADVLSLLPFDNRLVLCSIKGSDLSSKFVYTENSSYHNYYGDYGNSVKNNIVANQTYYVVVDTYTSLYAPNRLTVVEYYKEGFYARDLLAEAIKEGKLGSVIKPDDQQPDQTYTLTPMAEVIAVGESLKATPNQPSEEYYYVKGRVVSESQSKYGNLYLEDENGNRIYVYGLYDQYGNRYQYFNTKLDIGDEIVVYSQVTYYKNNTTEHVELLNATLIEIIGKQ
ncbi:MAG: bifunctional metallophosphatase/5'-nucleotidase [Clostridia bacterium]|nr:bifunctional metallophosphatase/5'-nucleotidase [Clostridia bacterium]